MGIRREEERNEKIIRGLMKLPPNRRCINCNSLGPQYVCTSFWTFICITCSGIHREFTHRVKSVSMSKFTSQEVEALQSGGNQRARELFLKDWDLQGLRLPDSSNVVKVRSFIKNVYEDRKYASVKISNKPPKDLQILGNKEEQIRRASSYHSYSQSPPYDHQYEDRKYGKQASVLTRRPGSDRGIYEGKISNFIYSPGRLSDQGFEDRFANEGSVSRTSNYSPSNGGDQCRSESQSPNFPDTGFTSPRTCNNSMRNASGVPLPQKAVSLGRSGSIDSNFVSLNSGHLKNIDSKPEQSAKNSTSLGLFEAPFAPSSATSLPSTIDLFQMPPTSSSQSLNLFQSSENPSVPSMHISNPQFISELSIPKNDGWATFDVTQPTTSSASNDLFPSKINPTSYGDSRGYLQSSLSLNTSMSNLSCQSSAAKMASFASLNPWNDDLHKVQVPSTMKSWSAFEENFSHSSTGRIQQSVSSSWPTSKPSFVSKSLDFKHVEESKKAVSQGDSIDGISYAVSEITVPSDTRSDLSSMDGSQTHLSDRKSTNPFDVSYDSVEPVDLFLQPGEPWFPRSQVTTPQGGLGYIVGTTSASQLQVATECPVVYIGGGNPFA